MSIRSLYVFFSLQLLLLPSYAKADPITFIYNGSVVSEIGGGVNGLTTGDDITLRLIVDNGGTDLISQTWTSSHFVSASLSSSGTYSASYGPGGAPVTLDFATDSGGNLITTRLDTTTVTSSDTHGSTTNIRFHGLLGNGAIFDNFGGQSNVSAAADPSSWAAVPEPNAFLMLSLIGLGYAGRKRLKM